MTLNSEDLGIGVIIDNHFKEFSFESYVHGFHVLKDIWNPHIGEDCLKCRHEKENQHEEFAIGVYRNGEMKEKILGHIPFYLSKAKFEFCQFSH